MLQVRSPADGWVIGPLVGVNQEPLAVLLKVTQGLSPVGDELGTDDQGFVIDLGGPGLGPGEVVVDLVNGGRSLLAGRELKKKKC